MIMSGLMLFAALLLVALNGLFVAAEFAFTKLRSTRVQTMVQEGRSSAELVREATGNLDAYLAVCQVGSTTAPLGAGGRWGRGAGLRPSWSGKPPATSTLTWPSARSALPLPRWVWALWASRP